MTNEEYTSALKEIQLRKKRIQILDKQRQDEELLLVAEYKVDECNQKRQIIIQKYEKLKKVISDEIIQITTSINQAIGD